MKSMLKYLRPYYKRMSVGLLIKAVGTLVELLLPYILSYILKSVVDKQEVRLIVIWGIVMIGCAALACICNICANRMAAHVARNFAERMRHDLFDRTLRLSAAQTDSFTIPSLESRITTDTYNISRLP